MPDRSRKRPTDLTALATSIVADATDEDKPGAPEETPDPAAVALGPPPPPLPLAPSAPPSPSSPPASGVGGPAFLALGDDLEQQLGAASPFCVTTWTPPPKRPSSALLVLGLASRCATRTTASVPSAPSPADMVGWVAALAMPSGAADDEERIDRIGLLEQVKAAAAAQAREAVDFKASQLALQQASGVPARGRGKGISAQVALARRESPHRGRG